MPESELLVIGDRVDPRVGAPGAHMLMGEADSLSAGGCNSVRGGELSSYAKPRAATYSSSNEGFRSFRAGNSS